MCDDCRDWLANSKVITFSGNDANTTRLRLLVDLMLANVQSTRIVVPYTLLAAKVIGPSLFLL